MAKIDRKELEEKSRSKYGKYQPEEENKFSKFFYNVFLKNSQTKVFINGGLTVGTFIYWIMTKDARPVFIWFFYILFINFAGLFYWRFEERRLNRELIRLQKDMQGIKAEILDRQKYFEGLKTKIDKDADSK
jgi:hypothetical protein